MKVKWETWKGEKFEGKVVETICSLLYVKLNDGSIKIIEKDNVTIVDE